MTDESPNELIVEVEGLGSFTFAKRRMRLEIKAKVELRRLTEGVELDSFTTIFLVALSDLKTLLIDPPKGWTAEDLDNLDPFEDESYGRVMKLWEAFRSKERPFRGGGEGVPAGGEGAS